MKIKRGIYFLGLMAVGSCSVNKQLVEKPAGTAWQNTQHCMNTPQRFSGNNLILVSASANSSTEGMLLIPGGSFEMGGDNEQAMPDEFPKHRVRVDSFYMDATEVTNAQFKKFVEATGYITTAERKP
ncbi:MAG TPA: SUMF1/EgtB/PvdO family nonheme iron enzyme, partial [Chitinophagaceae bacterium]|nr:SUMF1/EgtB/PvdO family nonheme iron enzyme [Chitinophagaceae bacterium]